MPDSIEKQANNAVLTEYHRACVGILEDFETSRKLKNNSSESVAVLRAYIVLFKKWGTYAGLSHPPSDESASRHRKSSDTNEVGWEVILCVNVAMIIGFSTVEIGVERPRDVDLQSILSCYYWAIGHDGEDIGAPSTGKAKDKDQTVTQAGYIWKAVTFNEFEDRSKKQRITEISEQMDYIGSVVEVLYKMVPSEELGRDIKEYQLALAGFFKQLGSTTSDEVMRQLMTEMVERTQ